MHGWQAIKSKRRCRAHVATEVHHWEADQSEPKGVSALGGFAHTLEWHSIRWQLILRSMIVTLITTLLLILVALGAIFYYYGTTQRSSVINLAQQSAQLIEESSSQKSGLSHGTTLVAPTIPSIAAQRWFDSTYLVAVFNSDLQPIYSNTSAKSSGASIPAQLSISISTLPATATITGSSASGKTTPQSASAMQTTPSVALLPQELSMIRSAIAKGQKGIATTGNLGNSIIPQSFSVQPIFRQDQSGKKPVGVVVAVSFSSVSDIVPPFLATVGGAILLTSPLIAVFVAIITLGFSRSLTRPLATLMKATRQLAAGDYQTQVETNALGELGELAHHFNEMAAQLQQQELWRRELIMNITHDLATPLTAIAGLGEALMDGMNESQQENEETGEIIVRETLRLHRLVHDLHAISKVETKALQPQLQPVCLANLINEVLAILVPTFEQVQVEPRNLISPTLPDLYADPDMLKRVFSNLCDNALKHTPAGGFITFEASQQANHLLISITDSGTGIPPEALARVFERFFRLDKARHSQMGGSGLGLAIVHAIVECHHGKIHAENAPEAGARFIMTLPCANHGSHC